MQPSSRVCVGSLLGSVCVCVRVYRLPFPGVLTYTIQHTLVLCIARRGPGRVHRRLVNEAGDVPEDMKVGRHFHVAARSSFL